MEIAIVIGLLVVAIVLFATEKVPVDIVTWVLLIILVLTGILKPNEAWAAFSSDFIVMLASIFVISAAIENSGIMDQMIDSISNIRKVKLTGILLWMLPFTAIVSGLTNNTTLTALLIPPLLSIARRSQISPSHLLMPMAFVNIVGGNWTIIGTSTNIAVNGYLAKAGYEPLGLFSIAHIGFIMMGISIVYMLVIGRFLIPARGAGKLLEDYKVRDYMSEVKILPGSSLIGQKVYESSLVNSGFRILNIIRSKQKFYPGRHSAFQEGDMVLVNGNVKGLLAVKEKSGIEIVADTLDVFSDSNKKGPMQLMEVLIPATSILTGRTVKAADFRRNYGMVVVAIHRSGKVLTQTIGSIKLQAGDLLLVQGTADKFTDFVDQHNLLLLEEHKINSNRVRKGLITVGVFMTAILLTSLNIVPTDVAFLSAAVMTVILGIIKADDAYRKIDWRMLVLIAGMTAFGTAMTNSGADIFISEGFISVAADYGPKAVMLGFMIITVLLTQPMSNAAAALVILPVALQSAVSLDVNPITFAVAIMLSASVSIITPFEPSCILIYSPGRYKFLDFIKVGGLLTLVLMLVIFLLVPRFWPL